MGTVETVYIRQKVCGFANFLLFLLSVQIIVVTLPLQKSCNVKVVMMYEAK